jgi:uncharacterized Zn finger protein
VTGGFGVTAWGRDWVRLAQPTSVTRPNPAAPRARFLAGADRVHEVELGPGRIRARVRDGDVHEVTVEFPTWGTSDADVVRAALPGTASTDLADDVHAALTRLGLPPAPDPATLRAQCSCRRRARPCPHLLAVYYHVACRLDEQPRAALTLRGLPATATARVTARIPVRLLDPAEFYTKNSGFSTKNSAQAQPWT